MAKIVWSVIGRQALRAHWSLGEGASILQNVDRITTPPRACVVWEIEVARYKSNAASSRVSETIAEHGVVVADERRLLPGKVEVVDSQKETGRQVMVADEKRGCATLDKRSPNCLARLTDKVLLHEQHNPNVSVRRSAAGEEAVGLGPAARKLVHVWLARSGLEERGGRVGAA